MRLFALVVVGIVVFLVALIGIVGIWGATLPRRHVAVSSAAYRVPPDSVWAAIDDWAGSSRWRTDVRAVVRLPDRNGHEVWEQVSDEGRWPLEIVDKVPPSRLVAVVADSSQGFGGTWTYAIAAEGAGSRLTITEDGFVDNPIFRFLARFVFGTHTTQQAYLRALGTRFGEQVAPRKER
jgi:uncharacterized protein YndB with AHSA1/START domain